LRLESLGIEGPGEQEALYLVDMRASKLIELARSLDAFREGREPEILAQLDERPDQRP